MVSLVGTLKIARFSSSVTYANDFSTTGREAADIVSRCSHVALRGLQGLYALANSGVISLLKQNCSMGWSDSSSPSRGEPATQSLHFEASLFCSEVGSDGQGMSDTRDADRCWYRCWRHSRSGLALCSFYSRYTIPGSVCIRSSR